MMIPGIMYMIENPFCVDKELEEINDKLDVKEFELQLESENE
jgi:hypothetical protein